MNISAKTEYACLAVLELAVHFDTGRPVRLKSIAKRHGIPERFLVQILLQLKSAQIVESVRGAAGGYRLQKPPCEVTLGEVMSVSDGAVARTPVPVGHASPANEALHRSWQQVASVQQEMLHAITFAELAMQVPAQELMYYI